jgi:AcrR family transcriptional regulator
MQLIDGVARGRREGPRWDAVVRRRRDIVEAAAEAFADQGFTSASLRDIAARAGLSHTGLLHHFPDKAALLEAVLDARMADAAQRFPFETSDGESFVRALVQATERDVHEPLTIRLWAVLSAEAHAPEHPAHEYFTRWFAVVRDRLTIALEQLDAQGRYHAHSVPPAMAALHLLTLREGANLRWLLAPEQIDLVDVVRSQTRLYVDIDL